MRRSRAPSMSCRSAPAHKATTGCSVFAFPIRPSRVAPSRWWWPEPAFDIANSDRRCATQTDPWAAPEPWAVPRLPTAISSPPCQALATASISRRVRRFASFRVVTGSDGRAIEGERTYGFESSRHPHLHAVSRAVAGSAVLALLRRQRAVSHRRHDAVLCHVGRLSRVVVGLCDARALARAIGSAARRCADLSRGFWRSGKAPLRRPLFRDGEAFRQGRARLFAPRLALGARDRHRSVVDGCGGRLHHRGLGARQRRIANPAIIRNRAQAGWTVAALRRLLRGPAAVDRIVGAGDGGGVLACEECRQSCHLLHGHELIGWLA